MLTWPHADTDWFPLLDAVLPTFAAIGACISQHAQLLSVCHSPAHIEEIRQRLRAAGARVSAVRFAVAPSNDSWARDHGPLTVLTDQGPELCDYRFNGWGGKFAADLDTAITAELHAQGVFGDTHRFDTGLVLEGGAIETDGSGTLLATRHSVMSATRNPRLDEAAVERQLHEQLGIRRFHWLDHGRIDGDDTDGHIDMLARFTDPDTIVYATVPVADDDRAELDAMADELAALRTRDGRPYRLIALPFPGVHRDDEGRRLPASYANFLISNGVVLVPAYGVAQDREALQVLRPLFPQRELVSIDCSTLVRQNGSLHCLTMQFPAAVPLRQTAAINAA